MLCASFLKTGCCFRFPDYKSGPLIYAVNNPLFIFQSISISYNRKIIKSPRKFRALRKKLSIISIL